MGIIDEQKFCEKADNLTRELKRLVINLEKKRDILLDEVAFKKGQASIIEDIIKNIYERILDVNKEVQQELAQTFVEEKKKERSANNFKGAKTPRVRTQRKRQS